MGLVGEYSSTPRSSPLKANSLSPNYALFNSPETHLLSERSVVDENDPFKSPLPVKKCLKRRYNGTRSPSAASSFPASSCSSLSSNWYKRLTPTNKVYKAKRKLPIHYNNGHRFKRICGNRWILPSSRRSPLRRQKGTLDFAGTTTPSSSPVPEMGVWGAYDGLDLSPEMPLLSTPQQRRIATALITEQKPEQSYWDCHSQSDDESVIQQCFSPEDVSEDETGCKMQVLTESLRDTSLGRSRTNMIDEGLDNLSQSKKRYQLAQKSDSLEMGPFSDRCSSRQQRNLSVKPRNIEGMSSFKRAYLKCVHIVQAVVETI